MGTSETEKLFLYWLFSNKFAYVLSSVIEINAVVVQCGTDMAAHGPYGTEEGANAAG